MGISLRGFTGFAFAGALLAATAVQALPTVTIDLGPPILNGNQAQMNVVLNFDDEGNPNAGVTTIQLDVSQSAATLTNGGTDFSRFSFTPSALLTNWDNFADFGPTASESVVTYALDTTLFPLNALTSSGNPHLIGTLNVNFTGLASGSQHQLDIGFLDLNGTFFFFEEDVGDPGTTEQADIGANSVTAQTITVPRSTAPEVPEPATLGLIALGAMGMIVRRRRA